MNARFLRVYGTFIILGALCLFFWFVAPNFGTTQNLENVLQRIFPVMIIGASVTLLMVAGSLDLSVAGVLGLSGVMAAYASNHGWSLVPAFGIGIAIGAALGLLNGLLVVVLRINPVIATLGVWYGCIGIANLVAKGGSISPVADNFSDIGTGDLEGKVPFGDHIPYNVAIAFVFVGLMIFIERKTLVGKYSVAMGSNFEGARLSGLRVNRLRVFLFVNAGLAAGIAGVLLNSKSNSGQPSLTTGGFEFAVIVAAVLGGVSLSGGQGTVIGTCAGAAIVGVIETGLALQNYNAFWRYIILGSVLIVIVAIDVRLKAAGDRASRASGLAHEEPAAFVAGSAGARAAVGLTDPFVGEAERADVLAVSSHHSHDDEVTS